MRSTDPDPQPFRPLGEKVVKPAPAPIWKPLPHNPGIFEGPDGRLATEPNPSNPTS